MAGARHGKDAALVRTIVELGFDFVSGITGAPFIFAVWILGQGIAPLNHEALDDPVKSRAIVESFFGEGLEILDRFRRYVRPELHDHVACTGVDNRHFVVGCAHENKEKMRMTLTSPSPPARF